MFAQKLPVLWNLGEMPQVWIWMTHFDEDCQTCPNMASYGILWPAMLTGGQLWLEKSRLSNSITVSAVSRNSAIEGDLWAFRTHCANNGGIWTEDATKFPICLSKDKSIAGHNIPQLAILGHVWQSSSKCHSNTNVWHFSKVAQNWQFRGKHSHKKSYLVLIDHIKTLQTILSGFCPMLAYRATYRQTWRIFLMLRWSGHNGANLPKIGHTRS